MAEKKYDLLLGPRRNSNSKIREQPWYQERLNTKYERKPLVGSSWRFIKEGLDDFRDGKPPVIDESIIIKGNKGVKPAVFGSSSFDGVSPNQRIRKKLSKKDLVYAKTVPRQEKQKQRISDVEKHLLDHPLALYSHLEESVPPDLFEEIVDLLDPSLTLSDAETDGRSSESLEQDDSVAELSFLKKERKPDQVNSNDEEGNDDFKKAMCSARNDPKLFKVSEDETIREEKIKVNKKKASSPQLTKIETVTKDFCDWIRDLGGEKNNIEEATVHSLFASGYETKPTLSVPVHVVELTNVPPELRADDYTSQDHIPSKKNSQSAGYTPSWVKVKYGAWYLDPKTWKSRAADEPLQDPKEIEDKQMSETKQKSKDLDKVLSTLHGAKAFRSFIEERGTRTPEFLETVLPSMDEASGALADDANIPVTKK